MKFDFLVSRKLMFAGCAIGIFISLFSMAEGAIIYAIVGFVIVLLSIIQCAIFYRCPECGYPLINVRGMVPEYCPKCGGSLKVDKSEIK